MTNHLKVELPEMYDFYRFYKKMSIRSDPGPAIQPAKKVLDPSGSGSGPEWIWLRRIRIQKSVYIGLRWVTWPHPTNKNQVIHLLIYLMLLQAIADDFNTEFDYQELSAFIEEHEEELGSATRTAHQMLESTRQ
jgi:hypothetical protein